VAFSTGFCRNRAYERKRCWIIFFNCANCSGSANINTPVIIIGLVGRSMRNHAVSTLDIGSRFGRTPVAASALRFSRGFAAGRDACFGADTDSDAGVTGAAGAAAIRFLPLHIGE
jgi:hypothetical protein